MSTALALREFCCRWEIKPHRLSNVHLADNEGACDAGMTAVVNVDVASLTTPGSSVLLEELVEQYMQED